YTGYMICFFLIGFFIYLSFLSFSSWKNLLKQIIYFGISSLSAALLSAFASVPTFYNLLENKLNYHLPAPVIDAKRNLLS
ncbi:YfhO family protein, partial [Streptococcus agalactiae]|uniref:YfhO family protein n=2 Tax=Lactobacillales TaxID=186826 RepID=UPI002556089C